MRKMKYKLKDIFDLQMGKTPSRDNVDYWNTNGYKWISIGDLSTTEMYISNTKEHLSEKAVQESRIKLIPRNTVVMSFKLSIGKTAITAEDMYSNEAIMAFHDKHVVDMLPKYIFYLFKYRDWDKGSNKAVMGKTLNKATLSEIEIELCSLEKQKEIVKVLDKIMGSLAGRKSELLLLDDLIKARFVEMFGDININDKNWNCEPLGELCTIVRGGSPRPIEQFLGGDVPWIKIGDATDGDNIYLNSTKEHIIQEGVKKSRLVKPGSLIFANCGVSLGFARIITFEGCIHDGWLAMEDIDERLDRVFLLQALNQMTEYFRTIAPAGTQPNLNTAIMKAYMQVIPPIELQRDYIRFVHQVDKSKVAVQKALDETQTLFDSLMQEYFG
ncbi:restriction endonuclease subunit S [Clostridium sp. AF36-4]|uniref:restriction endonuclease subunit S n=1 Tax=Clostridium sp. AF36-4 TaxID=2293015 RepID=UPI000E3F30EC|nr:restriction endonuclease subunit S [Clostridium sp. AF36-4]RGF55401.1 restriction endonuclease subunit S [Clostridium sp. AF36-4]